MNEQEYKIKGWVARDKRNNEISVYAEKPLRADCWWALNGGGYITLNENTFPELTWEDEPIEVELTIKKI